MSDKRRESVALSFEALRRALWIDESFEIAAVEVCPAQEAIVITIHGDGLETVAPSTEIKRSELSRFQRIL